MAWESTNGKCVTSNLDMYDYTHKISQLFIVIGFGWAMDNLWPIVTSLILPAVRSEFHPTRAPVRIRLKDALNISTGY